MLDYQSHTQMIQQYQFEQNTQNHNQENLQLRNQNRSKYQLSTIKPILQNQDKKYLDYWKQIDKLYFKEIQLKNSLYDRFKEIKQYHQQIKSTQQLDIENCDLFKKVFIQINIQRKIKEEYKQYDRINLRNTLSQILDQNQQLNNQQNRQKIKLQLIKGQLDQFIIDRQRKEFALVNIIVSLKDKRKYNFDVIKESKEQQEFNTDCQICFQDQIQHDNLIVYCSSCQNSFHQQCYNQKEAFKVSIDDDDKEFICNKCIQKRLKNIQIQCQYCKIKDYPMFKQNQKEWTHHQCDVIFGNKEQFNIVKQFQNKTMDYQLQQKKIKFQNKLYCIFCKNNGTLIVCQYCHFPYHFICGLINGCEIIMSFQDTQLIIESKCQLHQDISQKQINSIIYMRNILYFGDKNVSEQDYDHFIRYNKPLQQMNYKQKNLDYKQMNKQFDDEISQSLYKDLENDSYKIKRN